MVTAESVVDSKSTNNIFNVTDAHDTPRPFDAPAYDQSTSLPTIHTMSPPLNPTCTTPHDISGFPHALERVKTREDSSATALAFLAAVCSSSDICWNNDTRHHYMESQQALLLRDGSSLWNATQKLSIKSEDIAVEAQQECIATIDTEDNTKDKGPLITPEICPSNQELVVDGDNMRDVEVTSDHDGFSAFAPSSPTALSLSSPHHMSWGTSSSSERSATLPLSSPAPSHLKKASPSPMVHPGSSVQGIMSDISQPVTIFPSPPIPETDCMVLKMEGIDTPIPEEPSVPLPDPSEGLPGKRSPRTRSLSPLRAPSGPLPPYLDLSPLSSLLSSPLTQPFDQEPPSAISSHFGRSNSVVSSRSASPGVDFMNLDLQEAFTGKKRRRASTNVFDDTPTRPGNDTLYRKRSDTAPPEPTPRKRRRQSSPSSSLFSRSFRASVSPSPRSQAPVRCISEVKPRGRQKTNGKVKKSAPKSVVEPIPHASKRNSSAKLPETLGTSSDSMLQNNNTLGADLFDPAQVSGLKELPMTGFLVETLALSRASAMAAPELLRAVLKSQPQLHEDRSEAEWLALVRRILMGVTMFGRIQRNGTDAADRPLEDQWFYIPECDEEVGRAELLKGIMPKKRAVTKQSKQYYFQPVSKISRWDSEDD